MNSVTILQAILYWEGFDDTEAGHGDRDVITINNGDGDTSIEGERIGGPTLFFSDAWASTYRFVATNFVQNGANSIAVSGLDFGEKSNGAGIVVIVDDGLNTSSLELVDGSDCAFINFNPSLDTTDPVEFGYTAADFDRRADFHAFFASVALEDPDGNEGRPTIIDIKVFEGTHLVDQHQIVDRLVNGDGNEWDTYSTAANPNFELVLPAGSDSVVDQLLSEDAMNGNPFQSHLPASMVWVASSLTVPGIPEPGEACRVTGGATIVDEKHVSHGSGQAGAPTAREPQPWGEWSHHQRVGPEGTLMFHAGSASAIEGTELAFAHGSIPMPHPTP